MMKLVYAFYEGGVKALKDGGTINNIVNMATRERIGRFKYTKEDQIDSEYQTITEELNKEFADVTAKEDL